MATYARDLVFLNRILDVLDQEHKSSAFIVGELYDLIFEGDGYGPKVFTLTPGPKWDSVYLVRAVKLIEDIVSKYVQLFYDPREIPVTYYARQKRLAIHLDQQFSTVLREAVIRTGRESLLEADGSRARDDFLDEPILFLKQEARSKGFPKVKKGAQASLKILRERFEDKLMLKGANLHYLSSGGFTY